MKRFALIGAAGYVAPRHMKAIKETGNQLVTAFDPNDSVGVIDDFFPDCDFFTELERFDRYIDKLSRNEHKKIDYVSIMSPNYLHDAHSRFALKNGAHAICEKPLVLNPWNLDGLEEIETRTGKRIWNILQLRLHPSIVTLKDRISQESNDETFELDLTYITSRGNWYLQSWKGEEKKSGGIATNIGVHFFDVLFYLFGKCKSSQVHFRSNTKTAGYLEMERARVRWFLSVDKNDLPSRVNTTNVQTFRCLELNGEEIEFSDGFTDLHTLSYKNILEGNGFGIGESREAIEIVSEIRSSPVISNINNIHPMAFRL